MKNKKNLPQDIIDFFVDTLLGLVEINDLEKYIYEETRLEEFLHPYDYLDLISLDFIKAKKYDKYKKETLYKIEIVISKYIEISTYIVKYISKYETDYLKKLLTNFLDRRENLTGILVQFYNLYCHGFSFLQTLGIDYGCMIKSNFYDLTDIKHKLSAIDREIKQVLNWLDSGEIEITVLLENPLYNSYYDPQQNFNYRYYLGYKDRRI